jgi:N-acetylmuramoyl-L-alanine amidase
VIVLDPGHGGPDTGAMVNGVVEKTVALDFAQDLAKKLEAAGGFSVVMTRATDLFIPLSERVRIARAANAALMISIHADTLTESGDVGGATVYTVSDKASDAASAKVAAKENAADASAGLDGQADAADVSDILFDLTRQETRAYSHVFARTLVNYWKVAGRLNKNPERAAGFFVLKAPDVPSVLLELGYLSNPADSAALTSAAWRDKATSRMAEAIVAYFADRHGAEKAAAGVAIPDPGVKLRQAEAGAVAK